MTEAPAVKKKPRGLWLKVVLFSSLAINLLIVGMVAGAIIRGGPPGWRGGNPDVRLPLRAMGYAPYVQALSLPDRRQIGREYEELTGSRDASREDFIAYARDFLRALRARPFDAVVLDEAVVGQQERLFKHQQIGQRLLLTRIAKMTPTERKQYADRLERSLRRALEEK